MYFRKLGLAVAFSPRAQAMLAEAVRLKHLFQSGLVLIHVGNHSKDEEEIMVKLLTKAGIKEDEITICWRQGKPAEQILRACKEEDVDLLITGALKKEGLVQHYLGSVARRILRKSKCSVLTIINPSVQPKPFENIVTEVDESEKVLDTLSVACTIAQQEKSKWLHIVREIKLYSLTMSTAGHVTETEYSRLKQSLVEDEIDYVQSMLNQIPHKELKINIKVVTGKSGFELAQFTKRKAADLLVVSAPPMRLSLLDRLFPHDLEYIFADLPCNVLVVHPQERKEAMHD
jgi:nucleotide-binding universal stress UspA family protein